MKKRKLLAVVLSLALVFSMTSALTMISFAESDSDGGYIPETPDNVIVVGQVISDNQYIYCDEIVDGVKNGTPDPNKGYAYYKDGDLILHNFYLIGVEGNAAISAAEEYTDGTNAINIVLDGNSTITMKDVDGREYSAIDVKNLDLTISANTKKASLTLTSNDGAYNDDCNPVDCISAGSFELLSGTLNITAGTGYSETTESDSVGEVTDYPFDTAVHTYNGDVIVSGGKLNIIKAAVGISAYFSTIINDGEVNIGSSDLEISITACGIYSFYALAVNGGKLSIQNVGSENEGEFLIENEVYTAGMGVISYKSITIKDGCVTLQNIRYRGMQADTGDFCIFGGTVDIKDINGDAIHVKGGDMYISGGSTTIKDIEDDGIQVKIEDGDSSGAGGGSFYISGAYLTVTNAGEAGIDAEKNVIINNAGVTVNNSIDEGISSEDGRIEITKSKISIAAANDGIYATPGIIVKDSDVEVISVSKKKGYNAFYPTVTVIGKPVVYAGSAKDTAKRITDLNKVGGYQYVHIDKKVRLNIH